MGWLDVIQVLSDPVRDVPFMGYLKESPRSPNNFE